MKRRRTIVLAVTNSFTWQRQIFSIEFRPFGRGSETFPFPNSPLIDFLMKKKFGCVIHMLINFPIRSRFFGQINEREKDNKNRSVTGQNCARFEFNLKLIESDFLCKIQYPAIGEWHFQRNFTKLVNLKSYAFKSCRIGFSFNQFRQKNGQELACSRNAINRLNRNWK